MRWKIVLILGCLAICSSRADLPSSLEALWSYPTSEVQSITLNSYQQRGLIIEEVTFSGRKFNGLPTRIFGYFCYPADTHKPLPAILIVHGGGGSASLALSTKWARQNYATLSIDLPGKGQNRRRSRSTGPDMNVPILLKTSNLYENYLVNAVGATRNAITYLSRRKEVDPKRIGMIGLSWGGVITLLTNGQDQRLAAAVDLFGAGYIPEGCTWEDDFRSFNPNQVSAWYNYLDPKNFLLTQHAPILFMTGTNDHCYYLPTFQKSFEEIPGAKALWLIANGRHRFLPFMDRVALAWFDKYLKQRGGFQEPRIVSIEQASDNSVNLKIKGAADEAVAARVYYARGGPSYWTEKKWLEVLPLKRDYAGGEFTFVLPARVIDPEVLFYASVKDIFAGNSSTPVRSLFKVRTNQDKLTYGVSSAIKHTYRHDQPITLLNGEPALSLPLILDRAARVYRPLSSSQPVIRSMPADERKPGIL